MSLSGVSGKYHHWFSLEVTDDPDEWDHGIYRRSDRGIVLSLKDGVSLGPSLRLFIVYFMMRHG